MIRILIASCVVLWLVLLSSTASAEVFWPTDAEKLPAPVTLSHCKGIQIIEWKESSYSALTRGTSTVYAKMNEKCRAAKSRFKAFAKSKYDFTVTDQLDDTPVKIMVLPANQHGEGLTARNLNDPARWGRVKSGMQWGHTNYTHKFMLLRNDPFYRENKRVVENKYFWRTYLHELAHLFAYYSGLRADSLGTVEKDEDMAESFTAGSGYSSEDESAIDTYIKVAD